MEQSLEQQKAEQENTKKEINQAKVIQDPIKVFESGASWFLWIAGLSLINTLLILTHTGWSFIFGLTSTQFIDYTWYYHFTELSLFDNIIFLVLYLFILGSVVLSGFLSKKKYIWATWIGLIIVVLDGYLSFYVQDYWGVAFHLFIIFQIARGYVALLQASKDTSIIIKNQSGKQKLKFSAYVIFNSIIVLLFWFLFLSNFGA